MEQTTTASWTPGAKAATSSGYLSTQLYRSLRGHFLVSCAVWETNEDLRNRLELPEFKAILARLPEGTISKPAVMRKIAVAGNCTV
jgi:heme-degrading monooxygenase HmoA